VATSESKKHTSSYIDETSYNEAIKYHNKATEEREKIITENCGSDDASLEWTTCKINFELNQKLPIVLPTEPRKESFRVNCYKPVTTKTYIILGFHIYTSGKEGGEICSKNF
jgi:hypothetical protein